MIRINLSKEQINDEKKLMRAVQDIFWRKIISPDDELRIKNCFDYYNGVEPYIEKKGGSDYEPQVFNITKPIVDTETQVFIGEIPDITTSGKKSEKDKISRFVQLLNNRNFAKHIYETAHYSSKCGSGYLALFSNVGDTFPRFEELNPQFADVVYDCTLAKNKLFAMNVVETTELQGSVLQKYYIVYVYTDKYIYAYRTDYKFNYELQKPQPLQELILVPLTLFKVSAMPTHKAPHGFNGIPVIEFPNNAEYRGTAECVFNLIYLYNAIQNNRCKNVDDIVNYILMLKNVRLGTEEEQRQVVQLLTNNKLLPVEGDDVDAKFLTNPLDQTGLQTLANDIMANIHYISRVPDLSSTDFSQNASDPIIKIKTKPLLDLCKQKEKVFTEPYRETLQMILDWCKINDRKDFENYNFDLSIADLEYTHTLPSNDSDMITMITNLQNSKMANPEVLLQNLSFVPSVHEYIKGMDKWNDKVDKAKKENENNNKEVANENNLEKQKPLDKDQMDNKRNFNLGLADRLSENK